MLEYDQRTGAGLRETLEAFLACSGSWSRASEMLHLHTNTVRYASSGSSSSPAAA